MNKEDCKAARAVMEAWENGEQIEYSYGGEWSLLGNAKEMSWDFSLYTYRVRPKEQTIYLNIYLDDRIGLGVSAHWDKDDAIKMSGVPNFTKQLAIAAPITVVI